MRLIEEIQRLINEEISLVTLRDAILNKNVIEINYKGEGKRTIEPKLIGRTKSGNAAIRAYQIKGKTSTGNNAWKIFLIKNMENLNVLELLQSENRPKYNKTGDKTFASIEVQQK